MTEPELMEKLVGIGHLLCPGQAFWLYEQAARLPKGSSVLEIGTFHGCSGAALALGLKESDGDLVYSIDIHEPYMLIALNHWRGLGLDHLIKPIVGDSRDLLEFGVVPNISFAFIDGSHEGVDVENDYRLIKARMVRGGRIAFHDICHGWPAVKAVWDNLASRELTNHEFCGTIASGTMP